ncbi:DNA polymerase III subunit chi [Qipengyuania atrilutea]|uniref:DNA polymerase III subunit chi n=1 Tax=Qipengyuania atrilutea TaxID=2744473 RepID=A0A850H041_9SPHN|nr:DNA polymerase III subunit chi [Actirhodobacter atriluteus]NVD43622.1 DNA polymerase III subunit chi [Actirhodobacter atriluteus]
MRIDFYQLSRDPVPEVAALLARKVLGSGKRLIIIEEDPAIRGDIASALWSAPGVFLANGEAGGAHDARQPALLSGDCKAENGASVALISDGKWREDAAAFERVLLLFGSERTDDARSLWRELGSRGDAERHIFKQNESGGWTEGG